MRTDDLIGLLRTIGRSPRLRLSRSGKRNTLTGAGAMLTMLEFNGRTIVFLEKDGYKVEFLTHITNTRTFKTAEECEAHLHFNGIHPCEAELVRRLTVRR